MSITNFVAGERGWAGFNARIRPKIQPEGVEIFEKNHRPDLAHKPATRTFA